MTSPTDPNYGYYPDQRTYVPNARAEAENKELVPRLTPQDYERLAKINEQYGWGSSSLSNNSDLRDRVTTEKASKSSCCPCPNLFSWGNKKDKTD